ncbi:hypothetical protein CEE37_06890 [candidate division LCP-89 bacterium B3_LCP]|uniref:Heavy metal binding domain-containing protein n=1 Tax=candidate division LCP-89 bacterium B3_LCP TaxID=2012998 RepID=A0A532V0E8_UNCL8|nr:MAG: hypothetical protein CEE37_06890 [candidate division LCP-89 bacterium B3_LCP]
MNRNSLTLLTIAMLLVSLVMFTTGCTKKDKENEPPASMAQAEQMGHAHQGMVDENGKAKGATMGIILTAESLYICPMHPEIVTDNAKARCPQCGMNLEKMDDESKKALLKSHPKGCVMDPIVVPGDSETGKCAMCKMNLQVITKD